MKYYNLFFLIVLIGNQLNTQSSEQFPDLNKDYEYFGDSDKMGLKHINGNIIVPENTYDDIAHFHCFLARVRKNGNYGFIDTTGKIVIPLIYRNIEDFKDNLARFEKNDKIGFIDKDGKAVIEPKYDIFLGFYKGLALINIGGKIISEDGSPPTLSYRGGLWGMINRKGIIAIPIKFTFLFSFNEGIAVAGTKDTLFGAIDTLGNWIINPLYKELYPCYEGLCGVKINGKYGFLNRKGELVIKPRFADIKNFVNNKCAVRFGEDPWIYIDKTGKIISKE